MERLILSPEQRHEILSHARQALPNEAVGLLGGIRAGRDALVRWVYPLPNLLGPRAFLADPYSQYRAEQAVKKQGWEILGVFHSHPGGGTGLSNEDVAFAPNCALIQVVVAVNRPGGRLDTLQAFRICGELETHAMPVMIQLE